jgi:hypothetical protein
MRRVSLAALMFLAGCDSGPVGRLLNAFPDTLSGYRLGTMLTEVQSQAESLGDPFECDYQLDDRFVFCGPSAEYESGGDLLDFGFRDGELILITRSLGEDWNDVPFDTLRTLLKAYGDVPARTADTSYAWRRTERNATVQVTCVGPGARCTVAIGRSGR